MKFQTYERPELEEIELLLEGSFLQNGTGANNGDVGGEVDPTEPGEGENWD